MPADIRRGARIALMLAASLAAAGCEWFTDFKDQPRIEPWEAELAGNDTTPFRGNPQLSVPMQGGGVPGFIVSYQPMPLTLDSMAGLPNPRPVTDSSLENGRQHYQINCAVCHGVKGDGAGLTLRYGIPAPSLLTPVTVNRTDGYLYAIIRNGRGLMPTYDRIEELDRWDVVNYLRGLQGRLGREVSTAPAGVPGENGASVPGPSLTAPTLPPPHGATTQPARDTLAPAGGAPAGAPPAGARPPGAGADTANRASPPPPGARP